MSTVINNMKLVREEKMANLSKTIKKEKRKNQYTIEFKFGSSIDTSQLKAIVEVFQNIPPTIPQNIIFRLDSNVQIPLYIQSESTLGSLAIDPHSFNYRIIRYDKLNGNHIFHFEPIDRPFTPYELIRDALSKQSKALSDCFVRFHQKSLNIENYNIVSQDVIENFEKHIIQPYALYISKIKNRKITTLAKILNEMYLQLMGVNHEILYDYVTQTGLLPWFYSNNNEKWNETVIEVLTGNVNMKHFRAKGSNFQSETYYTSVTPTSFHIYDKSDDSYIQYMFYVQNECEKGLSSQEQIKSNSQEYFNRKYPQIRNESDDSEAQRRCKYKIIDKQPFKKERSSSQSLQPLSNSHIEDSLVFHYE